VSPRSTSRLAWSLWAVTMVLMAAALALVVVNARAGWREEDPFIVAVAPLTVLGFGTVGALVASRRPRNPIGWMFVAFALLIVVAAAADEYVIRAVRTAPGSLPLVDLAVWIQAPLVPGFSLLPLVFLVFPNGTLPSPRWRPVAWAMVTFPVIGLAGLLIRPGTAGGSVSLPNPTGVESLRGLAALLLTAGGVGSIITALVCVAALVVRFRRSRGEERQQVRWLAYVAAAAGVLIVATFSTAFLDAARLGDVLFLGLVSVVALGIPAASGLAILKYRLYDIDVVVNRTLVYGALAAFVTLVYVGIVVGVGALVGRRGNLFLSILATAVVALAFQPVRQWARHLANRLVYGKRATPYEVLSDFSDRVRGSYAADDVLPRMARTVAEGTGASHADVWLRVGSQLRHAASWPERREGGALPVAGGRLPEIPGSDRAFAIREGRELLGALSIEKPPREPLRPAEEKLLGDLASQAGLILRNVRLIEELRASRQRLVTAQDEERRRLERNIHDGAQQQLVALAVKLRLAENVAAKESPQVAGLLEDVRTQAQETLDDLRDLARGIYPPLLADKGLAAALESQARKSAIPIEVDADGIGRYPQEAEAAAYFCVLEALQNVAKYAEASRAVVRLRREDGFLAFTVDDDGQGFDMETAPAGSGLQNMADRVEALGGRLAIDSSPGRGTTVSGRIPVVGERT
jgi:signal transduction histidine kinase